MKSIVVLFFTIFSVLMACNSSKAQKTFEDKPKLESDTIRISNEEIEYDVIIIDDVLKFSDKMPTLWLYLEENKIKYNILPIDPDDGILMMIKD